MRVVIRLVVLASVLAAAHACAGERVPAGGGGRMDLGVIPIGAAPKDMGVFTETDCMLQPAGFADCSAKDAEGRLYVFFDGALSRVSATNTEAASTLQLPADVKFGEPIEQAADTVHRVFGVKLDRGSSYDGHVVYSSDFTIESSVGIAYSIELIADERGKLAEFVQRTDF